MKKIFLLLCIVPLFAFSQTEKKREYYKSGRLLSIINYTDGVRNGACMYFHDYGAWAIKTSLNYKNGKLIGNSKTYYRNGQVEHEGQYKYTEEGVYSRKEGVW
ncbi:MAG: antitoxin component YwqK of YwqJK toxin-antitoxin module, partial [Thalassomonas sp.]